MLFRKRADVIEAHRWWKNGDHPEDYSKAFALQHPLLAEYRKHHNWEGAVVGFFRHPTMPDYVLCAQCKQPFHMHGWIDAEGEGHRVCPGDWIITDFVGEYYPCKPAIMEQRYDAILVAKTLRE